MIQVGRMFGVFGMVLGLFACTSQDSSRVDTTSRHSDESPQISKSGKGYGTENYYRNFQNQNAPTHDSAGSLSPGEAAEAEDPSKVRNRE